MNSSLPPKDTPDLQSNTANTPRRLLAVGIDAAWIGVLVWALGAALPSHPDSENLQFIMAGILIVIRALPLPGGSIGERLSGIGLVNARTGKPLGPARAFVRQAVLYSIVALLLLAAYVLSRATKGNSERVVGVVLVGIALAQLTLSRTAADSLAGSLLVNRSAL